MHSMHSFYKIDCKTTDGLDHSAWRHVSPQVGIELLLAGNQVLKICLADSYQHQAMLFSVQSDGINPDFFARHASTFDWP
jgi:hypothetical protein